MSTPAKIAGPGPAGQSPPAPERGWAAPLRRDPLLVGAVAACALLLGFQLAIILLQPPWVGPVTDWLRAALAWPELAVVVAVARWLGRRRRPEALTWWLLSGGVACYAVARTWWTVDDVLIYHHGVPFPILPDLLFVLQYPFYFLAVVCIPFGGVLGPRLLALLDALLLVGAAAAIAWYFLLAPLFQASGLSPLSKALSLFHPVADLFLLLALWLILLRPLRHDVDRPAVGLIIAAIACLIVADVGATLLLLHPAHVYRTGHVPDLFWLASDLLIPLAALAQVRAVQRAESEEPPAPAHILPAGEDVRAALCLFLPLVAALLAGAVILLRMYKMVEAGAEWHQLFPPLLVGTVLLTLFIVRQAVQYLEMARLRREGAAAHDQEAAARAEERVQRELNRRKDELLGTVGHELRTPLTALQGFLALLARRLATWSPPSARDAAALQTTLAYSQASVRRITQLADDLADDARVLNGRLRLRPEPRDLGEIVRAAVEEQRAAEPDRTILLELPSDEQTVAVLADADRIGQVVANYLTNALKYSREERPVVVRLQVEGDGEGAQARVSVRDAGLGVPLAEQPRVWERFHVVEGNAVQSGSGVSLGLGLHISRAIVEGHGGAVGLESAPGRGSTFWFTLPLAHPDRRPSGRDGETAQSPPPHEDQGPPTEHAMSTRRFGRSAAGRVSEHPHLGAG